MIVVFVISLIVLNLGFSASIHRYIHPINTQLELILLISLLVLINGLSLMILFNIGY